MKLRSPIAAAIYVYSSLFMIFCASLYLYDRVYINAVSNDAAFILLILTMISFFILWMVSGIRFARDFLEGVKSQ